MSKRPAEFFLLDILVAIEKIRYLRNQHSTPEELKFDFTHWDSVIREFEIVGEAAKRLIAMDLLGEKERKVVDFRNLIAHHYFGIDEEAVVDVIDNHLPEFERNVLDVLNRCESTTKEAAIETFIEENRYLDFVAKRLEQIKGEAP